MALNPGLKIIAPWREWDLNSRSALIDYAAKHGIPVPVTPARPYSSDANLLHISYEGGILEDPWMEPPEDMFQMTTSPQKAPDVPEYVEITFDQGDPVAVNGQVMKPAELLSALNRIGGKHGIGRVDLVENRYVGMKSRGVYETPGGTLIRAAHQAIESLTLDREVMHIRDSLIPRYAEMVYYGYWFSPERELLQKLMDEAQTRVSGMVRLKLYKGNVILAGRKSDQTLYRMDFATFEEDQVYHQKDAEGFIRLNGLRLKIPTSGRSRRSMKKITIEKKTEETLGRTFFGSHRSPGGSFTTSIPLIIACFPTICWESGPLEHAGPAKNHPRPGGQADSQGLLEIQKEWNQGKLTFPMEMKTSTCLWKNV